MKIQTIYAKYLASSSISTDTRTIKKNAMFFALKGENFNANALAKEALTKGAKHVVIDDSQYYKPGGEYILVNNSLQTLQELAKYHRIQLGIPIIALTGSNGKTTTKELINAVLSKKFKTTATIGNLNNHIGVPLTLLSMHKKTEIGIVEMGANHFKEIDFLCNIALPDYGYITNFGKAHLEGFGTIAGVIKAKTELYDYLDNHKGTAFVNSQDPVQLEKTKNQKRILLGTDTELLNNTGFIKVKWNATYIQSQLTGDYNYPNLMAAIGIGSYFKVSEKLIKTALESYTPSNQRSQIIIKKNTRILLDAYNANPTSMKAALDSFGKDDTAHKIVILGDMFELGISAEKEHLEIAKLAQSYHFNKIILIGKHFYTTQLNGIEYYRDYSDFYTGFDAKKFEKKYILIKASRGMALERIAELFT